MKIYNYHAETKVFLSESDAQIDPLQVDNYLLPANATFIAQPPVADGEVAVFNGTWSVVKDNRGKVVYSTSDGSEVIVDYLGDIADGFTDLPRPDKYHLFIKGKWSMTKETEEQNKKDSVPKSITMRQARLALLDAGMYQQIDADIKNGVFGEASKIEWEYSSAVYRDSQFVIDVSSGLGISESDLDDLFILASKK